MNSRSIRLNLPEREVIELCRVSGVSIFSIECLPQGVMQIYCKTNDGADELRMRFRKHLVKRSECQTAADARSGPNALAGRPDTRKP